MKTLFDPIKLGNLELKNRIVLPPLTRARTTQPGDIPNEMMATYYTQRSEAGLIISEGACISQVARGYVYTPGIYTKEHIEGWKKITSSIHEAGSIMFAQLWHVGRIATLKSTNGLQPLAPSSITANDFKLFVGTDENGNPQVENAALPKEMTIDDINATIKDFHQAALNAMEAGFDGVELHSANGYIINQFLSPVSNKRTDEYGGSLENRLRFLEQVVATLVDAVGAEKVGVRFAPLTGYAGVFDTNPEETYIAAAKILEKYNVAYMHIAEGDYAADAPRMSPEFKTKMRKEFSNVIIYAGSYNKELATKNIQDGYCDMMAFGRDFISNPDLPTRLLNDYPLTPWEKNTFFGGDSKGYTDYPKYSK